MQGAQPPPGVQRVPRNAERKPHLSLKGGCREPLVPAGGNRGCPPVLENVGGWAGGTTAQAKLIPPLKEGAGQDKTIHPHRRAAAGVRGPCHTPLVKYERLCYGSPMKWAAGPLLFLGACRICSDRGLNTENPPVAGALREQPKGQDPPRKAGTGASAVIRHRRFGAIPLHDGSVTVRYGAITVPLQFSYGSFTACYALLRLCYGSTTTGAGGEEKTVTHTIKE